MTKKKAIPQISVPIMLKNGSIELAWYLFFQWIADNAGGADLSNYFTKEETEALLELKANTADLATVATSGSYNDLSNKPEIPAAQVNSDWNATSGVAEILNKPTIPTVNNATLTITQGGTTKGTFTANANSDVTIELDAGGGSADIDNLTITENASNEIQAVATVNANTATGATNPIYDWVGTMAEYEAQAVATTHPDWVCYIIDDIGGNATEMAQLAEAVNDKVDKGHEVIAFQKPTAGNNYTWYRKYADGWVEQGIEWLNAGSTWTLPVPMADTHYTVTAANKTNTSTNTVQWQYLGIDKTTTSVTAHANGIAQSIVVYGMAA